MTPRISPHAESRHTTFDHPTALTDFRIRSGRLRITHPPYAATSPNFAFRAYGDYIAAHGHTSTYCHTEIAEAIEARYHTSPERPIPVATRATGARRRAKAQPNSPALHHLSTRLRPDVKDSPRALHPSIAHRATA